ncbi:LysM peptidoglycan-binding domain-containing protein [Pseudidiomarina sp. 1APP75-32.1]|uniref:LysM peptidoglycan-binding domain-containing protein n=1 Tax=Pseudidiomarina terrestris TaxID=2820060 RepID=A0AAW7QXW0_9GAMM|nr:MULTISPECIES: LysM peptidoglycan-binding domain-containing protein [unclassified Pseudidiomarina]MDN7123908.1 LysM peptidoglycan-binding domain-containing protein [Pseudidiomarina sp. 1APP75-32.1]MDN7138752.1 LysM peptidoglycan-binding domain-containing protein [Pseudidiomarina sp. 1ASP75-14]MEA3588785.1 LysM peptidoglycan-binding domain-containing protein [Pseudidiomarina sp. 1APP75-27a]
MKNWVVLTMSALALAGCQSTPTEQQTAKIETKQEDKISPAPQIDTTPERVLLSPQLIAAEPVIEELTPQQEADVWERIRRQLSMPVPDEARITAQRNYYLKHPAYMNRVAERAAPFMHLIVAEIERRGLPLELALLPIVESAFDPFAYSHGQAAGVWQFIPGTARQYGLDINWWYDGRRDVYASTHAALDYLTDLNSRFDDWLHALAAYNSGGGRVNSAIRKNKRQGKATDFWSLDLPRETRAYVPKLLALADILKNQDTYQVSWLPIPNQPYLEVIETEAQIDLALAAEKSGLKLDQLHHYNSGYNRWATDPEGPHRLLLPRENAQQLKHWLATADSKDLVRWTRHKVQSGESLIVIAKQYQTTTQAIQQANSIRGHLIRAGDYLLIPAASRDLKEYNLSADQRLSATQSQQRGSYKITHEIATGDTFWDLSRKYNVNLRQLAKWNGMAPTDPLRPGRELVVWLTDDSQPSGVTRSIHYRVRSGDSLARIAQKFNVRIGDIEKWNQITRTKYLQPGQRLKLIVDVTRLGADS